MLLKRVVAVAFVGLMALAVMAPVALAEEKVCRGTIGPKTVDNLRVPQDASCTLNGARVRGTIKVENGATLVANGVRMIGNLQSEGFRSITLREGSRVGGSVQLENGLGGGTGKVVKTRSTATSGSRPMRPGWWRAPAPSSPTCRPFRAPAA